MIEVLHDLSNVKVLFDPSIKLDPRYPYSIAYSDVDHAFHRSTAGIIKVNERVANLQTQFHFTIIDHDGGSLIYNKPLVSENYELIPNADVITVCFTNNIGVDSRILSPWVAIHRSAHAWQCRKDIQPYEDELYNRIQSLMHNTIPTLATLMNQKPGLHNNHYKWVALLFGTYRSARESKITNGLDVNAEWFAQYHLNGIKLAKSQEIVKRKEQLGSVTGLVKWRNHKENRHQIILDNLITEITKNARVIDAEVIPAMEELIIKFMKLMTIMATGNVHIF